MPSSMDSSGRLKLASLVDCGPTHGPGTTSPTRSGCSSKQATILRFGDFGVLCRRWEALADEDGAHRDHTRAHVERHASTAFVGTWFHFEATGDHLAGAVMNEILERFEQAQFHAEWDQLRERLGDSACPAQHETPSASPGAGVAGPAAMCPSVEPNSTTALRGPRVVSPTSATADLCVVDTTDSRTAVTAPSATLAANGTPTDRTAPRSPHCEPLHDRQRVGARQWQARCSTFTSVRHRSSMSHRSGTSSRHDTRPKSSVST